ncbi:MAG: zinc-binding dehydrogenase, partial [Myxococcota bacterium]
FDAIGGSWLAGVGARMRRGGRIVVYGALGGGKEPTVFPVLDAYERRLRMSAFHLGFGVLSDPERRAATFEGLEKNGPWKPRVHRIFDFDQIRDAYRYLEASEQFGKIVVRIRP